MSVRKIILNVIGGTFWNSEHSFFLVILSAPYPYAEKTQKLNYDKQKKYFWFVDFVQPSY